MKKSVCLFYFGCLCQQESFSAAFNGRWCCVSHQKCLFLVFFLFFFLTDILQWEWKLAHGWTILNTNDTLECFRKSGIVLSHLKKKSKGKLFVTQSLGSMVCCPGLACSMSKSMEWQLLWWESLAPVWKENTNFGVASGMFKATPAASPGSELGMSSTGSICPGSFVYVLRICL